MKKLIALAIITCLTATGTAFARDSGGGGGNGGSDSGAGDSNSWDHSINSIGATSPGVSAFTLFIKIPSIAGESEDHSGGTAPAPAPTPPPSHDDDCMACP